MHFEVNLLRHWKTDYGSQDRCEDAAAYDVETGLFAVSDGVGEVSFSNVWSDVLVNYFLEDPLRSEDPFEVERWVREARKQFDADERVPAVEDLPRYAQDKAREGSAATFVGIQLFAARGKQDSSDQSDRDTSDPTATCRVVATGDSCCIHYNGEELLGAFPRSSADDFKRLPVCFPTTKYRGGWWKYVTRNEISLHDGDLVVLATDAVSQWLLHESDDVKRERIRMLLGQTEETWPDFLAGLRRAKLIEDDDSTAIVIRVGDVGGELPKADSLRRDLAKQRQLQFVEAWRNRDEFEIALQYGDGHDLRKRFDEVGSDVVLLIGDGGRECLEAESTISEVKNILIRFRQLTDGRREILETLQHLFEQQDSDNRQLQRIWNRFRKVMIESPAVANLRDSLRNRGIQIEPVSDSNMEEATPSDNESTQEKHARSTEPESDHGLTAAGMAGIADNSSESTDSVPPPLPSECEETAEAGGVEPKGKAEANLDRIKMDVRVRPSESLVCSPSDQSQSKESNQGDKAT